MVKGKVHGDPEAAAEEIIERDIFDSVLGRPGVVLADVVGHHLHAEGAGEHRDLLADASAAEDAERLALPEHAGEAIPFSLPQTLVRFDQPAAD